jgi:hypothetical protein
MKMPPTHAIHRGVRPVVLVLLASLIRSQKLFYISAIALLFAGCASLGIRTEGKSGPVEWRVVNIATVTREIEGRQIQGQAWTVVIKNVSDRTVTFTTFEEIRYQPQTNPGVRQWNGNWVLRPGADWNSDRFSYLVCNSGHGCTDSGSTHKLVRINLTGKDDQGRPVEAHLDITLPPGDIGRGPTLR